MATENSSPPVVAGIDGSPTAMRAVLWAVDEAVWRDTSVQLIYATKPGDRSAPDYAEDVRRGHDCLREARTAIEATGKRVHVETSVVDGPAALALVSASKHAQMVCVGSLGIGRYARSLLGSTAAEVAEKAHCPVAVIRPDLHGSDQGFSWIVVAVTDRPENGAVVEHALQEARLRRAPVLALGDGQVAGSTEALKQQIRPWHERYPEVRVYPIANRADVAHFLKKHDEPVLLAVIGSTDADEVAQIVGHGHSVLRHGATSALVVRS